MINLESKSANLILAETVGSDAVLTIAGGVTTLEELAELDRMGVEAQVIENSTANGIYIDIGTRSAWRFTRSTWIWAKQLQHL